MVNVEGGTSAWRRAGFPVVGEPRAFSPQRQVQIVAGALVVVGSALGVAVNPLFILIPAITGAGLVYTGMTGTCILGMLLAGMPWNRRARAEAERIAGVSIE